MKKLLSSVMVLCMVIALLPAGIIPAYAADSSFSAQFSYNGKRYSAGGITGTTEISLSTILSSLEITGDVTAASVSEGQGMTVTTTAITLTKAFGTGWLRVTAGGTEYEITITSTPDSISVVLYGTLFFDKNGGSGIMDGQSVREYSTTVLPDCTFTPPDGYEFDQWEINGARYNAGATFTFGQTTTAKAIWKLREGVHSITAAYNSSDGDVVVSPTMAAAGEQVTVTVQPVAGKAVDSISYSFGSTSGQALSDVEGGVYTFSMPGENTTVSVTFKEVTKEPIAYVDENGSSQNCNDYRYVRSTDTIWSGWVVASQNLTLDRRVTVSGTVNLILMDGKTLTVTGGIQVGEGSTLNIYAQSGNTGELIAGNKQNSYAAGIGGNKGSYNAGTITVNGGQITATGGYSSAGIGGASEYYPYLGSAGNITIRGNANVVATGGEYSSGIGCGSGGIGGSITIDGNARVQARALEGYSGSGAAIGSGRGGYVNSITISGGTVIATGANMGSAIGNGNSNSGGDGGTISITGGDVTATATGSWGAGIGGLCKSITIGGNAVVHATGGNRGAGIGGYYQKAVGNITVEGNANVTATGGASGAGIGTGSEAEGEAVITITGGTVNASMSASNGAAAIGSGYKSKGKTTVSISGGQVTALGSSIYGVGIGGGNTGAAGEEVVVNITGGAVDASGRAGIGTANASNAKLTINISGGKVTARGAIDGSNKCAAIGQGNNSNSVTEINITGGIVRALGTGTGIGSGANSKQTPTIKLGYTDETKNGMEITAIDYNGTVTLNKSFKYQDGTGAVSTPITANKTIVPSDSTAHTHGFTYTVDGKTITATCTNSDNQCNLTEHKATLTIGEPDGKTSMVYDGTAKAAVLTGDTDVLTADVVYKKGNTVLPSAPSDAGNYTASITLGEATATVSYEITKKSVTFASITAKDKVYDGTTKASCTIGTGLNGAVSGDNVYADVYTGNAAFEDANAGVNKKVTFSGREIAGTAKGNYELIQPEPQYRAITPRVITITAKAQTVPQGGTVVSTPEQVEVTGGTLAEGQRISEITLTGDTSALTTSGTVTPSVVKILDASDNDVTANYAVNYAAGTLTVTEAPPHTHDFAYSVTGATITATCSEDGCPLTNSQAALTINAPTELTYDGAAKAATITGEIPGVTTPEITYTKKGDASFTGTPKSAGTYAASITVEGATASVEYTIAKAAINPTLVIQNKTYDGKEITYTTENNPGGGEVTSFSWEKKNSDNTWSSVSDTPKDAGKYRGTAVIGETDNYQGANTNTAEFTISKAALTVTAKPNTITYGDAPANDGVTYSGFVNNETESVLSGTLDYDYGYTQYGNVGNSYTITPKGLTSDNYEISFVAGTLTVEQKEIGLTWSSTPLTYSGSAQAPTAEATGTVNGDTVSVTVSGGQTDAGTGYTATASGLTGDKAGNYKLPSANSTTFAIGKAALTVTAKPKTITYGDAPTNDGVEYSGFVNSETESVLGGTLGYDYSYTQYGDVGSYTITPKGLTSGNYEISFVAGTLNVEQKEVGLTWSSTPLTFNGTAQAPTAEATGTVNGDAVSVTVSDAQTDAGTGYTATASSLTGDKAGNYKLPDTKTTTFAINKAAAQTLADVSVSQVYTLTGVSASVAGKMPGDAGALTYAKGTAGKTGSVTVSSWDVDSSGNVTAMLSGGAAGDTVTLPVTVGSTNYGDSTVSVVVTLRAKDDAGVSISDTPPIPLQYLDMLALIGSVQNPGTNGTWTWTSSDPDVFRITPNGAEAVIEAVKVGTATITASYASDTTVGTAVTSTLTVNKAEVSVPTVASKVYTGGNLTADVAANPLYSVTANEGGTAVGSYDVVLTLTDFANYKWTDSDDAAKTLTFQITKATAPEVTVPTPSAVTYDPTKTLADVMLPEGWAWTTPATVPTVVNTGYTAALTVDDANYDYTGVEGYDATTHKVTRTAALAVNKADPTATAPTATAIYGQTLADVNLTNPTGNTAGTWAWAVDTATGVGSVGSQTFKANFTPKDTTNYNSKSNVDVTVAVGKAANPATVTGTATVMRGGNTVDLANNVAMNGATGAVSYTFRGEAKGCSLSGSVLTSGENTGSVTVNISVAADGNYNAFSAVPVTVIIVDKGTQTVTASDVTAAYGDTGKRVSAATSGDGTLSYAVTSGDAVSINASSGALTIVKAGTATVTVTASETATCKQASRDVTVTVNKAASTMTAPTAKALIYTGAAQELVGAGTANGGTMQYALGTDTATEPDAAAYAAAIPTGTEAGT